MQVKMLMTTAGLACTLTGLALAGAQAQGTAALTGQVTSAEEGPMEGVLVSAKKDGGTITVTVVSDQKGEFSFPAGRLDPGHYTIAIGQSAITSTAPRRSILRPPEPRPTSSSPKRRTWRTSSPTRNG